MNSGKKTEEKNTENPEEDQLVLNRGRKSKKEERIIDLRYKGYLA